MLVLERCTDEVIVIGKDIRVMVVSIKGGKVKIGVDAPAHVQVDRLEIREQKEKGGRSRGDWHGEE